MLARWLAPVLLLATPSLAQSQLPSATAAVGAWIGQFLAAVAEPNRVVADCAPKLNAAMTTVRDSAGAQAALPGLRECGGKVRAAYLDAGRRLDALPPLDPAIASAMRLDPGKLVADHRRLGNAMADHVDTVNQFAAAMAAGNRAALPSLAQKVRAGGVALIDASILQQRLQTATSPMEYARQFGELRIILGEAARALIAAPTSAAGVTAGSELVALGKRAATAVDAGRTGWQSDREKLASGGADVQRVVATVDIMAEAVFAQGQQLAALLSRQPGTLSHSAVAQLATDLNAVELAMLRAGQQFAATLQKSS